MYAIPLELKEANKYVARMHRHHPPVHRDKFRLGCADEEGIHGVIQIARPVSRILDDGQTLEVVRCCTDGTKNACSFLYARAARIAREMGYKRIITYILQSEDGVSLEASGWHLENEKAGGGNWDTPGRPRKKARYPIEKKKRYAKELKKKR